MPIQLIPDSLDGAKIRVVGVGGGGGNIINSMVNKGIEGVEFIAVNTDAQALEISKANVKIQIGKNITKGLGTGMKDEIGMKAVEESRDALEKALAGSDMVFITAGMGGGTGTGGSPEVAHIAKSLNALVVAIVTKPFDFEGKPRMEMANQGLERLKDEVDSLIVIPNQKIFELISIETDKRSAFELANKVLYNATKGISQIITKTGEINVDFADVRTIMKDMGDAMIGTGIAEGENRAEKAALDALSNPLLDDIDIAGSKSVLVNISSNGSIKMSEIGRINQIIQGKAGEDAKYILGIVDDMDMKEDIMVTVIATGFQKAAESAKAEETEEHVNVHKPIITELPKDQKEYKELDVPAWKRRYDQININDDLSEDTPKKKEKTLDDLGFDINIEEKFLKTPGFLRRQMD
ncbi:MAG: cell division protein FtsZ [Ignavibacteriae bacterium]|nr:cell division protein FtsZ [Ignavibacteriota bacterium]